MSHMLGQLMGAQEPFFSSGLERLEQASGRLGVDVQLTADILTTIARKTRELGLDPKDTSGRELYHALYNLTNLHDSFLVKRIGGKHPADVADVTRLVIKTANELDIPKDVWVLKASVIKRLLKAQPPKGLMKELGYRSVDSMLKREKPGELYAALRFTETQTWMDSLLAKYKKLGPSDFETRKIEILHPTATRWNALGERIVRANRHNVSHVKELGVIVVYPLPVAQLQGIAITLLPLLVHFIAEIRHQSAYVKLQQVRSDFGSLLAKSLQADPTHHATMAGHRLHWRVIARRYGKLELNYHPEVFEPHVMPEDLHYHSAEDVLYRLEPALHFWHGLEYAGVVRDGQVISFNLMDMAVSFVNRLSYGYQLTYHLQDALHHQLLGRYLGQPGLEAQVLSQLGNDFIEPDMLMTGVLV